MEIANNVLTQEQIWEQRRYEAAKEFMSVIMGRANYDPLIAHYGCCGCGCGCSSDEEENYNPYLFIAQVSVDAADALIDRLKEKEAKNGK